MGENKEETLLDKIVFPEERVLRTMFKNEGMVIPNLGSTLGLQILNRDMMDAQDEECTRTYLLDGDKLKVNTPNMHIVSKSPSRRWHLFVSVKLFQTAPKYVSRGKDIGIVEGL